MTLKGHMLDYLFATVAALGLAIVLSVQTASAMDVPPSAWAQTQVLAP